MRAVDITFACGHRMTVDGEKTLIEVQCAQCGQRRVKNVSAPRPTVRAVNCDATSPLLVKE